MRVKISYGANIQEVPEEVDQLYTYVSSKARAILRQSEQIEELLAEEDLETTLLLVDRMRKTLTNMDLRLADIEAISMGYLSHQQGDDHVPDRRPPVDPTGLGDVDSNT